MKTSALELNHLRYFYEVARNRGYTRAESALRVQQSAISKMVQNLEGQVGARLLERSPAGVRLTPIGARLYASCERIFAEVEGFSASLTGPSEVAGELRIATATHVATHLLPPVIAQLRALHPRLVPRVVTGPSHLLEREIEERRMDVGLFFKVAPSRLLERQALADFPCQLVVKRGLGRRRDVLETFIGSREVDDLTNRSFPTVAFLRKRGYATEIRYSCNSLEAHRAWVIAGLGISILPRFVVDEDLAARRLELVFPSYTYQATLELITRRGDPQSAAREAFRRALQESLPAAAPSRRRPARGAKAKA